MNIKFEYLPLFQQRNFMLAAKTVNDIISRDNGKSLNMGQIQKATKILIPARMEVLSYHDKTLILDGSHNEQKISALVEAVKKRFNGLPVSLLVGFGENKKPQIRQPEEGPFYLHYKMKHYTLNKNKRRINFER